MPPPTTVGAGLGAFGGELWDELASRGRSRSYERGGLVFVEGDRGNSVFAVVRGRASLGTVTRDGREIVIAHKGPGEIFGELAAIDGLPRSATATALDDLTVLVVPGLEFLAFIEDHTALALPLLQMLASRLRSMTAELTALRSGALPKRVAAGLVALAEREGTLLDSGMTNLHLRHEDLASWLGVNREAVTRALRQLRDEGLIQTARGSIELSDLVELRRRAV